MITRVTEFCRQKDLLCRGDHILIGLSGGADSVCLFLVLKALQEEWQLTLTAVHVNHNLRGEDALADERFCGELCRKHGVKLYKISADVEALAGEKGWSTEEAGRYIRYAEFRRIKEEAGCHKIAVAHHKNDQAETVLFQLLRGSRVKGLAGMEAKREDIIRPMLCVTREEIERYLKEQGQPFCTDKTNAETVYTRNRIRHRLLPEAEQIHPGALEHITETAEYLGEVECFLEKETMRLYEQTVSRRDGQVCLCVRRLQEAEPLLAKRVVYRALCEAAGQKKDMTAQAVRDCFMLCDKQSGRSLCLPQGVQAIREFDVICLYREREEAGKVNILVESFPFETELPYGNGMVRLTLVNTLGNVTDFIEKMGGFPKSSYTKWFDYDKIKNSVSLRTTEPEDRMTVYTDGRRKPVADVLAEAKIPREKRKQKIVLVCEEEVLWIPGIRGSEAYRIGEQTKRILIVQGGKY